MVLVSAETVVTTPMGEQYNRTIGIIVWNKHVIADRYQAFLMVIIVAVVVVIVISVEDIVVGGLGFTMINILAPQGQQYIASVHIKVIIFQEILLVVVLRFIWGADEQTVGTGATVHDMFYECWY